MPPREGLRRLELKYFDGVNAAVGDHVAKIEELSHAENFRSNKIGVIEKRGGHQRLGASLSVSANYGLYYSEGLDKIYRVSDVSGTRTVYYLDANLAWTALTGEGTGLTANNVSFAETEQNLFIVNGVDANRFISSDGTTVSSATSTANPPYNHAYNSPPAYKVNYYKNRLYLADYTLSGGTRQRNGIMFSSPLVGIVSLVSEDHTNPVTTLTVEDTKYIYSTDVLDVYRGGTRITATLGDSTTQFDITNPSGNTYRYTYDGTGTDPDIDSLMIAGAELTINAQNFNANNNGTFVVTAVDANYFEVTNASGVVESNKTIGTGSITVNTISVTAKTENTLTIKSFANNIQASDELWVYGTKLGNKFFRWSGDGAAGTDVKEYDTFKLDGPGSDEITMLSNVGDVMIIGSKKNMAAWNGYNVRNFNAGIGCVSSEGYVVKRGILYFVDYKGIAATDGDSPPVIISAKVKRYFDGASRTGLEASVGEAYNDSVFFYIGDVTLYHEDGSTEKTLSDTVIEYNTQQENWWVHTGIEMEFATSYLTQSDKVEYIAFSDTTNDFVFLFPYGKRDNTSDIFCRADTSDITLSKQFENISFPRRIMVDSPQGNAIKSFISLDKSDFYEIKGDARKGCSVLYVTPRDQDTDAARCRNIKISIRESSRASCKLNRIAIRYDETQEEEEYRE